MLAALAMVVASLQPMCRNTSAAPHRILSRALLTFGQIKRVSRDEGRSWTRQLEAAPWAARSSMGMVALPSGAISPGTQHTHHTEHTELRVTS